MTPSMVQNDDCGELPVIALYLPHPDGAVFDPRKVGQARSSWALYSRLNRMKKRHCPSTFKSMPRQPRRKRCKQSEKISALNMPMELGRSRWGESLPSTRPGTSAPNTTARPSPGAARRAGTGRPTLPKRQASVEHTKGDDNSTRKGKINQAAAGEQALRSFRRSLQTDSSKARFAESKNASMSASLRARCA